jgi:hypothetical protein
MVASVMVTDSLTPGMPLPVDGLATPTDGCQVLVFADPRCGGCGRLAENLRAGGVTYSDTTGDPLWLLSGGEAAIGVFARRYGIPRHSVRRLQSPSGFPLRELGISATPTLVGTRGPLVTGQLVANDIPLGARLEHLCGP